MALLGESASQHLKVKEIATGRNFGNDHLSKLAWVIY